MEGNHRILAALALGALLACWTVPVQADVHYVSAARPDDNGDGLSWITAKKSVQAAISAAWSGDEVWVAAGTYNENVTLKNGVKLYGGFPTPSLDDPEPQWTDRDIRTNASIIDGSPEGRCVYAPSGVTSSTIVDGFALRNGTTSAYGGGVLCYESSPIIRNNILDGNHAGYGGGIACRYGSPIICNNLLRANTASHGSGVSFQDSSAVVVNNTITGDSGTPQGSVYIAYSSPTLANNIIAFNSVGIYKTGGGTPVLWHNCVYNTGYSYNGLSAGSGDINTDPLFTDGNAGDYRLTYDSPCVDAGDDGPVDVNWRDLDGGPRVVDVPQRPSPHPTDAGLVDIGPYELDVPVLPAPGGPEPEPGDENELAEVPETVVYDSTPSSSTVVCEDSELGEITVPADEVSVTFVDDATLEQMDDALDEIGAWRKVHVQAAKIWVVGIPAASDCTELESMVSELKMSPLVVDAGKNGMLAPCVEPNDGQYFGQWGLGTMGLPAAWEIEQGKGAYSTVGVVDSGVWLSSPDLQAHLQSSQSYVQDADDDSHGTCVTGIIAAVTDNEIGIAGVGWDLRAVSLNAKRDHNWATKVSDIARLSRTIPGGIAACNMSYHVSGTYEYGLKDAMNALFRQGVLPVVAVGNASIEEYRSPAKYARCMAVGGVDYNVFEGHESRWQESTYGEHLSVLAPSDTTSIYHPPWNQHAEYDSFVGTSCAAPFVTGVAALVRSEFQSMGPLDIRHRIEDTASDNVAPNDPEVPFEPIPGYDRYTGWGSVKADQALSSSTVSCTIPGNKWNLVVLPVWPKERGLVTPPPPDPPFVLWQYWAWPQTVFPAPPPYSYRWIYQVKPGTDQYYSHNQYDENGPLIGLVKPYRAFWVKYHNYAGDIAITVEGATAGQKTGHYLEFPLHAGMNLVGIPFTAAIAFDDDHVGFRLGDDSDIVELSDAVERDWIDRLSFRWDPVAESYVQVEAGTVVQPFQGFTIMNHITGKDKLYMLMKR